MTYDITETGPWKLFKRGPEGYTELESGSGPTTSADYTLGEDDSFMVIPQPE